MMFTTQLWLATLLFTAALALALPPNLKSRKLSFGQDLQASLSLDPSLVQIGYFSDGLTPASSDGKVASDTSFNNFINHCATRPGVSFTNGEQVLAGSCSSTPMGFLAPKNRMPHAKFVFPFNTAVIPPNTTFTIRLAVRNLVTGHFANPDTNFHAAPQETDPDTGEVIGHSHMALQTIKSLESTEPIDPQEFVLFKGLNEKADDKGELSVVVPDGLPDEGFYRLASINSATNHQPALVAVAQRGPLDDMIYFEVRKGAKMPQSP